MMGGKWSGYKESKMTLASCWVDKLTLGKQLKAHFQQKGKELDVGFKA